MWFYFPKSNSDLTVIIPRVEITLRVGIKLRENAPQSCSSDPSRQSLSPSQTWLNKTHSVPSLHGTNPVRHFKVFDWAAGEATAGQSTSSEPSAQWERPSQTRFLEIQLLWSLHLKSSGRKDQSWMIKLVHTELFKSIKNINLPHDSQTYEHWFTFGWTCSHTKVLILSSRAVLLSITQLGLCKTEWCAWTWHRGFFADWTFWHYTKPKIEKRYLQRLTPQ